MRRWVFFGVAALLVPFGAGVWAGGPAEDALAQDRKQILGSWAVVEYDQDGARLPAALVRRLRVTVRPDRILIAPKVVAQRTPTPPGGSGPPQIQFTLDDRRADEAKYLLKRTKKGKVIELTRRGGRGEAVKIKGVYALEGDALTLCIPLPGRKVPKTIPASPKAGLVRLVLQRAAAGGQAHPPPRQGLRGPPAPLARSRPVVASASTLSLPLFALAGPLLVQGPAAETELGKRAAAMEPGTWAELKTEGYSRDLLGGHDILVYADRAVWDPRSGQVLFLGQDHLRPPPRFVAYQAAANRWQALPTPAWAAKLKWFHGYQNTALDAGTGRLFHHSSASRLVHQYDIARAVWSTLPEIPGAATGHGTALEYFPERKGLVRVLGGVVHFYHEADKTWSVLNEKKLAMGPYHNFAAYSAAFRVVLFGGGNGSRDVYRLDTAGKIAPAAKAPVGLGIGQSITWADPASGELLVLHKEKKLYAYSPGKDAWREVPLRGCPLDLRGSSHHVVAVPISTHGVTLLFTSPARGLKVYLYKHAGKG